MASWWADGGVAGYNAAGASQADNQFVLVATTPGMVDLGTTGGITRLQYPLPQPTYQDDFRAIAPIRITAADVSAHPDKKFTVTMFVIDSSYFVDGVIPTPQQIIDIGPNVRAFRAGQSVTAAGDYTFVVDGPRAGSLASNTKYWVLLMPTMYTPGDPPNYVNDKPINAGAANTLGHGLSLWTNRTPAAPTITSPATGSVAASGSLLTFSFTSSDPDAIVGSSSYTYTDLAGIQVQYAPRPTAANPNPTWIDLPIASNDSTPVIGKGWYIDGSTSNKTNEGSLNLWNNRTMQIKCGSNVLTAGAAALPSGSWQIRCRTFDYGHPYPVSIHPAAISSGKYTPSNFPKANTSPWSAAIQVTVSAQVPPVTLVNPINDNAIAEGKPVTLSWLYRNTATPPYAQAQRTVQLRKVGDAAWQTLVSGNSSATNYPVPLPTYLFHDSGDALDGWSNPSGTNTPTLNDGSVRGTRTGTSGGNASLQRALPTTTTVPTTVTVTGRIVGVETAGDGAVDPSVYPQFFNSSGVGLSYTVSSSSGTANTTMGASVVDRTFTAVYTVAAGMASVRMNFAAGPYAGATFIEVDDITVISSGGVALLATTEYEWRVQVTDSNGVTSVYSEIGRFWIVPAPGTGEIRPLPTSTIEGATLGVGNNRVFIYRRGGKRRLAELTQLSYVNWGRMRDEMSDAKVVVSGWDTDQGNLLSILEPWAYELVIFRVTPYGSDRVWEGPITLLTYEREQVTISAKDVMAYPYRRIIKQDMNDASAATQDTVTSRAVRVLQNTLAADDPNVLRYLTIVTSTNDTKERRSTPKYSRTAYEEIDDMAANAGLDYTAVGRAIIVWGTKNRIGTLPEFSDKDLGSTPIVSVYGMAMANRYAVTDGNGNYGEATRLDVSGNDPVHGLVEMLSSTASDDSEQDTGTYTQAGLAALQATYAGYAERAIANRYPAPVIVRIPDNTTLNPDAVVSINHLVPGVVVPLRSTGTLRNVVADQKLDSVTVTQQDGKETITITLSPFNEDDASTDSTEDDS